MADIDVNVTSEGKVDLASEIREGHVILLACAECIGILGAWEFLLRHTPKFAYISNK